MNEDHDVSRFLRDVYDAAPTEAESSAVFRNRTIAELRRRGLIESPVGRRAGAWLAAALVVLAFTGGYTLGSRGGSAPSTSGMDSLRPGNLVTATELVQGTGTSHFVALEELVRELGRGSATDLATARAVVQAVTVAQSEAIDRLLEPSGIADPDRGAVSAEAGQPGVVWF